MVSNNTIREINPETDGSKRRLSDQALYKLYQNVVLKISKRYSHSYDEAYDIAQESFIKIFNNINGFRNEASLKTWITRITINTALNSKRNKLYSLPMLDINNVFLYEDEQLTSQANFLQLCELVNALPKRCKNVFELFALEGYGHKEISTILKISEGTSKSQLARAKRILRSKLVSRD